MGCCLVLVGDQFRANKRKASASTVLGTLPAAWSLNLRPCGRCRCLEFEYLEQTHVRGWLVLDSSVVFVTLVQDAVVVKSTKRASFGGRAGGNVTANADDGAAQAQARLTRE